MSARLTFAVPSKGRLMEQTAEFLGRVAGCTLRKVGHDRGYRGDIEGVDGIDVAFISASEIVAALGSGRVHIGVTGEDLVRENISNADERVTLLKPLGFGRANVVVAVPRCWLDVSEVADLEAVGGRVPPRARAADPRGDEVHQPGAALPVRQRPRRTIASSRASARRRERRPPARRISSSTSRRRARRSPPTV